MPAWESLSMTISLIVIAVAFLLLLGSLVALCLLIRRVIKRFGHIGHVIENRISPAKECRKECRCMRKKIDEIEEELEEKQPSSLSADLLEFGLLGLTLWQKIKEKRR
jgi:hypothetical protein